MSLLRYAVVGGRGVDDVVRSVGDRVSVVSTARGTPDFNGPT